MRWHQRGRGDFIIQGPGPNGWPRVFQCVEGIYAKRIPQEKANHEEPQIIGWRIAWKDGVKCEGAETYNTFQEAMLACAPDKPVWGTKEWKKTRLPWDYPIGPFSFLSDWADTWGNLCLKISGVTLIAIAVNLGFRCFGK